MTEPKMPSAWGIEMSKVWTGSGQPFPVDVKQLALEITKHRDDRVGLVTPHGVPGIDGMLSRRTRGDWVISYDETVDVPGRINFTLAHEFGHYLCHRRLQSTFNCGESELLNYSGEASRKIEKEANVFASYLLMPADDFRRQIDGLAVSLSALGDLAKRYRTSLTATTLKWLELTAEVALLAVVRNGHTEWSYASEPARRCGAYIRSGTPIAEATLRRAAETKDKSAFVRVAPGAWHPSFEADESVIVSDRYAQLIFLVRFPGARTVDHDEEESADSFDVMSDSSHAFKWST